MAPSEGQIYKPSLDTGERIRKSFSEDQFTAYLKESFQNFLDQKHINVTINEFKDLLKIGLF